MRVQELFKKVDAAAVADAYFVMHTIFYPYEHRTLREKIHAAGKLRQMIAESIQGFISCNAMIGDRQKTIFLFEEKETEYPPQGNVSYSLSAVYDEQARGNIEASSMQEESRAGKRIAHYEINMDSMEKVAGYLISELCVKRFGEAACCAEILYHFFSFGFTDEERQKNITALQERLKTADKEIAEGKNHSLEELCEELHRKLIDNCEDPDLRQYMILTREHEKRTADIISRHRMEVLKENQRNAEELVREEYENRRRQIERCRAIRGERAGECFGGQSPCEICTEYYGKYQITLAEQIGSGIEGENLRKSIKCEKNPYPNKPIRKVKPL